MLWVSYTCLLAFFFFFLLRSVWADGSVGKGKITGKRKQQVLKSISGRSGRSNAPRRGGWGRLLSYISFFFTSLWQFSFFFLPLRVISGRTWFRTGLKGASNKSRWRRFFWSFHKDYVAFQVEPRPQSFNLSIFVWLDEKEWKGKKGKLWAHFFALFAIFRYGFCGGQFRPIFVSDFLTRRFPFLYWRMSPRGDFVEKFAITFTRLDEEGFNLFGIVWKELAF